MDPTNNPTPTPNPTPAPGPAPIPGPAPVTPPAPDPMSAGGFNNPAPAAPAAPAPTPVNPVVQPTGAPVNPVIKPTGIGATDPIMMPEKPAEPDPVEQELKAPMKAAAPVPGSIGSAVSGPSGSNPAPTETTADNPFATADVKSTPSVSFNDPATQPDANVANPAAQPAAAKKNNKTTLIVLISIAAVIVLALAGILIWQLMVANNSSTNGNSGSGNNSSSVEPNGGNSSNNSGNASGNSSNSGNGQGGGSVSPTTKDEPAVICTASYKGEDNTTVSQEVSFVITDSKLDVVNVEVEIFDENDKSLGTNSEQMDFDKLKESVQANGEDMSELIADDGTLKVSKEVFAQQIQAGFNVVDSENAYTCVVE